MSTGARTLSARTPAWDTRRRAVTAPPQRAGPLRGRWPAIAAFAVLLATIEALRVWSTGESQGTGRFVIAHLPWLGIELATLGAGAIAGPVIAELAGWQGWRHIALTAAATTVSVGIGAAALHGLFPGALDVAARHSGFDSGGALLLRGWWFFSIAGWLFGAFAGTRDRELATQGAARRAALECAEIERDSLGLQLQSLETQLEPSLVFDRLDEIAQLYRLDPADADELLDRLIAYLRSAIPRVSAVKRTLADEAALAKAYLRVLPEARVHSVDVAIDIALPVQQCPFPRKVLLPLVAAAAAAGAKRIRLVGTPMPDAGGRSGVEVSLMAGSIGQVPGWTVERCTEAQRLLADCFGPSATVERRTLPEGVALVLACRSPGVSAPER
jgi:hypothetical protein